MDVESRSGRAKLARQTLDIIEKGKYTADDGQVVDIQADISNAIKSSQHFSPEALDNLRTHIKIKTLDKNTVVEVTDETSLGAAQRLIEEGFTQIGCLNFASAKNPGGGFLGGSRAQEESLARCSALYPTLTKHHQGYYAVNGPLTGGIYTDNLLFSPSVPVFRHDDGHLLAKPFPITFITCPAVNAGAASESRFNVTATKIEYSEQNKPKEKYKKHKTRHTVEGQSGATEGAASSTRHGMDEKIVEIMERRIENILSIAAEHHLEALILGAWGCGVFKNSPEMIASLFAKFLNRGGKFENVFKKIVFAIFMGKKTETASYAAFETAFAEQIAKSSL